LAPRLACVPQSQTADRNHSRRPKKLASTAPTPILVDWRVPKATSLGLGPAQMKQLPSTAVQRSWYAAPISRFLTSSEDRVLAELLRNSTFTILQEQRDAWLAELAILRRALPDRSGMLHLEFSIPRMGSRADAVVLIDGIVFVMEFKIGAKVYSPADIDQACDYAVDLKYFHEGSHGLAVIPILVASEASQAVTDIRPHARVPGLYEPVCTNASGLQPLVHRLLETVPTASVDPAAWGASRYRPTPTIIEAARALYAGHHVAEISRHDAGAINLGETSDRLLAIIEETRSRKQKAICFVTGVPGAGKTLVGLNIATKYNDPGSELHSTYLSGNGPLVAILREALARDMVRREKMQGRKLRKTEATTRVKAFIQNVHHFRDEYIRDQRAPVDHVALFDEAQRAWDRLQTAAFMKKRSKQAGFPYSEPEFLISCMDRRDDWAVIVCLVGGGQEIHRGEAGIGEWIQAVRRSFDHWHLHISDSLFDTEYAAGRVLEDIKGRARVNFVPDLHLGVSIRSFRSEKVSAFVKQILDCEAAAARGLLHDFIDQYPIRLTRDLDRAKQWLRDQAVGNERYGIVVSSQAERLKPLAMDVRTPVNPVKWFLDGKDDVRSSYYLEDVATEFHVQGLELDWTCVSWDGDFRYDNRRWQHFSFRGTTWQRVKQEQRKVYLKNAYRVLLTRARQGMVIFVPRGSGHDPTRDPRFYDSTYRYLQEIGLPEL